MSLPIVQGRTALLLMDMQNMIVSRYTSDTAQLAPFKQALETARLHGLPVIFVRVAFREGHVNVSARNKMFGRIIGTPGGGTEDIGTQIHAELAPRENEPIVTKIRVSAFAGSDLEAVLRSQGIDSLVLSGIATSGVVLSTLREAADKDYGLTVLADACLDQDADVHRVLTEKVFPVQADVMTVEEWAASLGEEKEK
ncbi:isochorismatase family cysteine hydrolase [Saccharibacillus sacchari]|uniref:Isochorismatase family cysteine hydrolase n=1 Tax=Saccharibacillus sacchari TaxID=456493 RepID=A0ACC6P797_9BACL